MDNNDFENDQEKKSLLNDMAKKGISKKIKGIPPTTKLIIIGAIIAVVFSILMFAVIISAITTLLFGGDDSNESGDSNLSYVDKNLTENYWWPIGGYIIEEKDGKKYATGSPTVIGITSEFGARTITSNGVTKKDFHSGIDIGNGGRDNYIIATMSGFVYQLNDTCDNGGYLGNYCGGGLGNYLVIKHASDVYTVYGHLAPNSIRVRMGEEVTQGQIIAMMGNSGNSTGKHLHFQVDVGGYGNHYAVDPLGYISPANPRPVTVVGVQGDLLTMLQSWEGTGPTTEDDYIVYDDGTGVLTVGHGVTLIYNKDRFRKHKIEPDSLSKGDLIPKNIVDAIELEIVKEKRKSVINLLEQNGIELKEYQIDALTMRIYNVGNIDGFPSKYKEYGDTQALYDNYMKDPVKAGGQYMQGLVRRREAEWNLFHNGIYELN